MTDYSSNFSTLLGISDIAADIINVDDVVINNSLGLPFLTNNSLLCTDATSDISTATVSSNLTFGGSILDTIQGISTTSSPTFANVNISAFTNGYILVSKSGKVEEQKGLTDSFIMASTQDTIGVGSGSLQLAGGASIAKSLFVNQTVGCKIISLLNPTNQIHFIPGINSVFINCIDPTNTRTYTIGDAGVSAANFMMYSGMATVLGPYIKDDTVNANTFIGLNAGQNHTSGSNNTVVGEYALNTSVNGSRNAYFGSVAAFTPSGSDNVSIGCQAAFGAVAQSKTVSVGTFSGPQYGIVNNSVYLGYRSGGNFGVSDRLCIASDINRGLITGEFDNFNVALCRQDHVPTYAGGAGVLHLGPVVTIPTGAFLDGLNLYVSGTQLHGLNTAGTDFILGPDGKLTTMTLTKTTNQIIINSGTFTNTLNYVIPAANRVYTLQDMGVNCNFIMSNTTSSQTINAPLTASGLLTCTAGANVYGTTVTSSIDVGSGANFGCIKLLSASAATLILQSTAWGHIDQTGGNLALNYFVATPTIINNGGGLTTIVGPLTCSALATMNLGATVTGLLTCNTGATVTGLLTCNTGVTTVGTTTVNISNDTANATINVGTGAGNKTVTVGSTTGTSSTLIQGAAGITCSALTTFSAGLSSTTVATPSITINGGTALTRYTEETLSTTVYGIWASPKNISIRCTLIGNVATISFLATVDTATISTNIITSAAISTSYRPISAEQNFIVPIFDNGTGSSAVMRVSTNGLISIWGTSAYGNFAGTGISGLANTTVTYNVL